VLEHGAPHAAGRRRVHQREAEIEGINMVWGATGAGVRSMIARRPPTA
jgi:pyruvate/2-oxoacid:ferredoxin oxidoreductase alpha subunit